MQKKKELSSPNSCLNRAAENEPIFVLRANDDVAPDVVRIWAEKYKQSKGGLSKMTTKQIRKYNEALELASMMVDWKIGNP